MQRSLRSTSRVVLLGHDAFADAAGRDAREASELALVVLMEDGTLVGVNPGCVQHAVATLGARGTESAVPLSLAGVCRRHGDAGVCCEALDRGWRTLRDWLGPRTRLVVLAFEALAPESEGLHPESAIAVPRDSPEDAKRVLDTTGVPPVPVSANKRARLAAQLAPCMTPCV